MFLEKHEHDFVHLTGFQLTHLFQSLPVKLSSQYKIEERSIFFVLEDQEAHNI
jgi:hypothetical protein